MKKNRRNNSRPAAIATAKDTTKAIETRAGVLKEAEDVKKEAKTSFYLQYMGKEISGEFPPMAAIPTTAGTGSEATKFTVITDAETDVKMLLKGAALLPDLAIVDYTNTLCNK